MRKVFDDGCHNAMTDLARWNGWTWLCFRRGEHHFNFPPGEIVVLRTRDLASWQHCATIRTGLDDRDPKFLVGEDRLWIFFGSARIGLCPHGRPRDGGGRWAESYATYTRDGERWESPRRLFDRGWWLWRPVRLEDGFFCAAYGCDLDPPRRAQFVDLLRSDDGIAWERVTRMLDDLQGNETVLHQEPGGRLLAFVRGHGNGTLQMAADPPYTDWTTRRIDHWLHAPASVRAGKRTVLAGRDRLGKGLYVARLWEWKDGATHHLVDLPSGGDTSYCGLLAPDAKSLLVSYYSQHEFLDRPRFRICHKPAAIYLARIELSPA